MDIIIKLFADIFFFIPKEMWEMGFFGQILSVTWLAFMSFIVFLTTYLLFLIGDGFFLTYHDGIAKIISHQFLPAHTNAYSNCVNFGNSHLVNPQTTKFHDRYYLLLTIDGLEGNIQVTKEMYDSLSSGNGLTVKYSKNRFTNSVTFENKHI